MAQAEDFLCGDCAQNYYRVIVVDMEDDTTERRCMPCMLIWAEAVLQALTQMSEEEQGAMAAAAANTPATT
jgi:hypothetical protein